MITITLPTWLVVMLVIVWAVNVITTLWAIRETRNARKRVEAATLAAHVSAKFSARRGNA